MNSQSINVAEHHVTRSLVSMLPLLAATLLFVELLQATAANPLGYASMSNSLGTILGVQSRFGIVALVPLLSGILGALFGNATLANLTVSPIVSAASNIHPVLLAALQTIGAGLGSALGFSTLMSASTLVRVHHHEGLLLRRIATIIVPLLLITSCIGILLLFWW